MKLHPLSVSLALAALSILAPAANAQSIGINFGTDAGASVLATDQPGVVAGANWNNVPGASGSNIALQDSNATLTSALLTFSSTSTYSSAAANTPNAGTNAMYTGTLIGNNRLGEINITVANIPYAVYDVYVYATTNSGGAQNTLSMTDGTTTFYFNGGAAAPLPTSLLQTTSTNPASPTSGGGQYQLFSGLTGSSVNILTGGSIDGVISNNVYGLQIVSAAAVPEPGTTSLIGGVLITSGLALIRRRK